MKAILLALVLASVQISAIGHTTSNSEIAASGKLRCGMIAIRSWEELRILCANSLQISWVSLLSRSCTAVPMLMCKALAKGEWDIAFGPRVLAPIDTADVTADGWVIPFA